MTPADATAAHVADRLAVGDLAHAYAVAVDRKDLAGVARLFTPDCVYQGRLGTGTIAEALAALEQAFARYERTMHCISTQVVALDGDRGRVETACVAHHVRPGGAHFTVGVRYRDEVVRTAHGWRICRRSVETEWAREDPPDGAPPRA